MSLLIELIARSYEQNTVAIGMNLEEYNVGDCVLYRFGKTGSVLEGDGLVIRKAPNKDGIPHYTVFDQIHGTMVNELRAQDLILFRAADDRQKSAAESALKKYSQLLTADTPIVILPEG